uniref:Uncharacterized protein n=1 Tax=Siphoviridae sp. ctyHC15 TaxID=2826524 RepID=A0A8S5QS16_9CAUD|nr:MAG TPA: hypothetical protein [Siphoviridae sp. ctyHC15]DAF19369.1 MAG TPA: hypothetical protein [Bacteriophage sp.]
MIVPQSDGNIQSPKGENNKNGGYDNDEERRPHQ